VTDMERSGNGGRRRINGEDACRMGHAVVVVETAIVPPLRPLLFRRLGIEMLWKYRDVHER
jgi:hypothetical protein